MITPSTITATLGVLNAKLDHGIADADIIAIQVSGTWVGTITFSASVNGTDYIAFGVHTLNRANNYDQQSTTTINGIFTQETYGVPYVRVQMTSYTSGTATILLSGVRASK
jgi:hypothetical protein